MLKAVADRLREPDALRNVPATDSPRLAGLQAEINEHQGRIARAERTRAQELKLIRECDATLVVSPVEKELLARELPRARVDILSNVHEVFGCRRAFAERGVARWRWGERSGGRARCAERGGHCRGRS